MRRSATLLSLLLLGTSCIAPSVVDPGDRSLVMGYEDLQWSPAAAEAIPGTYVSEHLSGAVAGVLLKLVYRFDAEGNYTGAALIDGAPPHFEGLTGHWSYQADHLQLDEAAPATVEMTADGWLRLTGEEGAVILRREIEG